MAGDFPVEHARAHVEALAKAHHIVVYEIKSMWKSESDLERRTVYVADPTTALRYMVALHEIGHIVDKVARLVGDDRWQNSPAEEAAAWSWAYDHADPALLSYVTPRGWRRIGRAWVTSLGKAARQVSPRNVTLS